MYIISDSVKRSSKTLVMHNSVEVHKLNRSRLERAMSKAMRAHESKLRITESENADD